MANNETGGKMATEQELNELMARFAGFEWVEDRHYVHGWLVDGGSKWEAGYWTCNGQREIDGCRFLELPDFPNDIGACFRWIVPILWVCDMTLEDGVFFIWTVGHPQYGGHVTGPADENPAIALCRAIEKMVGEEKR